MLSAPASKDFLEQQGLEVPHGLEVEEEQETETLDIYDNQIKRDAFEALQVYDSVAETEISIGFGGGYRGVKVDILKVAEYCRMAGYSSKQWLLYPVARLLSYQETQFINKKETSANN